MAGVPALTFFEARESVLLQVRGARSKLAIEEVALSSAAGRVLAENIAADRDTPALARSVRDGYAVRAGDTLKDEWDLSSDLGIYHLRVYGPNGFFREFTGDNTDPFFNHQRPSPEAI